jgi:mevalonate kinase
VAKNVSHKIFHAKVLLFGEQIINKGATGLAVPWHHFYGVLKFNNDTGNTTAIQSNRSLAAMAEYIIHHATLAAHYDTNRLLEDIDKGLYFDSNIPQGYGLGSSGALVASLYNQYRKNKKKNFLISELKQELAELESFFHGKSSGLDPIVCYLDKAVLITAGHVSEAFDMPNSGKEHLKVFLINTHLERKTSEYVNLFLKKCEDPRFMKVIQTSLIPANDVAVSSFMQHKHAQLMKSVKIISQVQYDLLPEFIPARFKEAWQLGLKNNEFHLKICGAGGGGFIIGFAKANANLPLLLGGLDIIEMMKF